MAVFSFKCEKLSSWQIWNYRLAFQRVKVLLRRLWDGGNVGQLFLEPSPRKDVSYGSKLVCLAMLVVSAAKVQCTGFLGGCRSHITLRISAVHVRVAFRVMVWAIRGLAGVLGLEIAPAAEVAVPALVACSGTVRASYQWRSKQTRKLGLGSLHFWMQATQGNSWRAITYGWMSPGGLLGGLLSDGAWKDVCYVHPVMQKTSTL